MSKQLLGILQDNFKSLNVLLFTLAISLLFSILSYILCSEIFAFKHLEIYVTALNSTILFACTLGMILWIRKEELMAQSIKRIVIIYLLTQAILLASAIFHSTSGMLIFLNLQFLLMITINTLELWFEKKPKSFDRLEDFQLTNRQQQVANLIMKGLSYNEIADQLSIAENTASKHGSDIFAKTECDDRRTFYAKFFQEYNESRMQELKQETEKTSLEEQAK